HGSDQVGGMQIPAGFTGGKKKTWTHRLQAFLPCHRFTRPPPKSGKLGSPPEAFREAANSWTAETQRRISQGITYLDGDMQPERRESLRDRT
ncbi:MAG: hypothetical protein ACK53L_20585, partial [Pirellulaceae bacterium]